MAKRTLDDVFNNDTLGLLDVKPKQSYRQSSESIYVGMYHEIRDFIERNGREPSAKSRNINEARLGQRLDALRKNTEAQQVLAPYDTKTQILQVTPEASERVESATPRTLDDVLSSELLNDKHDIFRVADVIQKGKKQSTNDYQATRKRCEDFEQFKPLFEHVQRELDSGVRRTSSIDGIAEIQEGQFFIVGGLIAYVAHVGEKYEHRKGHHNARMRVIFSNGTESDLLLRSFGASLHKDKAARAISGGTEGPLFREQKAERTGIVYVLKSKSELPQIAEHYHYLHKIGATNGAVKKRVGNPRKQTTYLRADIEVAAEYTLYGYQPKKVERVLQLFFSDAQADIKIRDGFGDIAKPREWYFVPLEEIAKAVELLQAGELTSFYYDTKTCAIRRR